jgi:hypothetical protein
MMGIREMFVEDSHFKSFEISCSECGEVIMSLEDVTDRAQKNEALLEKSIADHVRETGHVSFDGVADPLYPLEIIDVSITVNG